MIKNTLTASLIALAVGSLTACTTTATSNPPRTATEQMLISTAAERAALRLSLDIPPNTKIFVESGNFEGTDSKYAVSAIRARLLHKDLVLVDDKKAADEDDSELTAALQNPQPTSGSPEQP